MASPKSPSMQSVETPQAGDTAKSGAVDQDDESPLHQATEASISKSVNATNSPNNQLSDVPSEPKEASDKQSTSNDPPLPDEPVPGADGPPLPKEPAPEPEEDGWEYHWVPAANGYWFYNRFQDIWQENNPRVPSASAPGTSATAATTAPREAPAAGAVSGGYNPAVHGDYDPNAWYAQTSRAEEDAAEEALGEPPADPSLLYAGGGYFNKRTGAWQTADAGPERHSDDAKSRRQMNAFFDVNAAADAHDGRSLRAERAGKKPSKAELKAFKEKRKAKKEEKRRAWLRD